MPKPLAMWITTNCGKFFKSWEYQTTWPASWETCMQVRKQQLELLEHGTTAWFQIGKGVCQGCILSPCLFNLSAECAIWNAGLDEAQTGVKIAGRNINNLRYADDTTLTEESEEELKSLLMKVKEESENAGLKVNIHKKEDLRKTVWSPWSQYLNLSAVWVWTAWDLWTSVSLSSNYGTPIPASWSLTWCNVWHQSWNSLHSISLSPRFSEWLCLT